MSEWKKVRLGEVCDVRDGTHASPKEATSGRLLLTSKNLIGGRLSFEKAYLISNDDADEIDRRSKVDQWDVLFSMIGTVGEIAVVKETPEFAIKNVGLFKTNGNIELAHWVYYYFRSPTGKMQVYERLQGTTQQYITLGQLREFPIPLPPLPTQRKIAAVLGALDDKIENNRKICANLEAQAQAIFKSWFVDFEPFGGKMPQGWKEVPLSSIATYLNGLAMQKYRPSDNEDSFPVLKIKELRQGFCDTTSERCSASIDPRYVIHDGDVIFSWSGSLLVDFWCGGTAGLNQHLFKVHSDKYDKWFVYSWTNHYLASFIKIAADKATTMGHITRDHLDDAKVCIPFDSDIEQVGRVMKPLYDEIITKRIESRALAATRDALLPKLMSGEIDVEKVEVA